MQKQSRISPLASLSSFQGRMPILDDTFVADGARIIGDVIIQKESSVWFNAVLRGDVTPIHIGQRTNIQDNSVIHGTYLHPAVEIGSRVTIGHMCMIHGCTIEDEVLVGMGSIILDGAHIGKGSLIGAGTLITMNVKIPPRSLVLGSPYKIIREVKESEWEEFQKINANYHNYTLGYSF